MIKTPLMLRHFLINADCLPRQPQDKRRNQITNTNGACFFGFTATQGRQ
jgi:hypothetical protein